MYYNIEKSGIRIRELRKARGITRQKLADEIGISLDAMRKIETGKNGAKIDTLVSISNYFCVSLDYLVCGCEKKAEIDSLLARLNEKERQFIKNIVLCIISQINLIEI